MELKVSVPKFFSWNYNRFWKVAFGLWLPQTDLAYNCYASDDTSSVFRPSSSHDHCLLNAIISLRWNKMSAWNCAVVTCLGKDSFPSSHAMMFIFSFSKRHWLSADRSSLTCWPGYVGLTKHILFSPTAVFQSSLLPVYPITSKDFHYAWWGAVFVLVSPNTGQVCMITTNIVTMPIYWMLTMCWTL